MANPSQDGRGMASLYPATEITPTTEEETMSNGTWKRTTTAERRAARKIKYAHVSVKVGITTDLVTGMLIASRTPKGDGATARRVEPKSKPRIKGHDWLGAYPGRLASIEKLRKDRRNARKHVREATRRAMYFDSLESRQAIAA